MESLESKSAETNLAKTERQAEDRLDALLANPDNTFLSAYEPYIKRIDDANTAVEALTIAEEIIMSRLEKTFKFNIVSEVEGAELGSVNFAGVKSIIDLIQANQQKIGEGGDAWVVIDKSEIANLPPEICYKLAKDKELEGGQNSLSFEAKMQGEFLQLAKEFNQLNIGVPKPFYAVEMGKTKMLAMEKLDAKSIKDIANGEGIVPDWLDIDLFCKNFKKFIDECHLRRLYHRDLHYGNVMITQSEEPDASGDWGYVIDFGYSDFVFLNDNPYQVEVYDKTFTHKSDDVIMKNLSRDLLSYQSRNREV